MTLNPAIDLVIITKELKAGVVNRTESFELQPNGKGVNVSFILQKLGISNIATGIGGGFTLDYVKEGLEKQGIPTKFLKVDQATRVNVFTRVLSEGKEYKEVNPGPIICEKVQIDFLKMLSRELQENDLLIVSGSFGTGIEHSYLVRIAELCQKKKVKLVIDSSYPEVLDTLPYHPFLLKPNDEELAGYFGELTPIDDKTVINLARKLIKQGCQYVLVSLGERGGALISKDKAYFGNAPKIQVLNTVGAGDTMLGTFIGKYLTDGQVKKVDCCW
ncbi:tagatose-6-phosphate kinase 1-phosphofructokinase [Lactobacillus pasteurii DSM 23907 = CRBIP 24.76]|nr:tagatose-6-phosphate kinase 1-phosphofructokinase [Lactobacillus pasteurii DSM 23907 = CRBIP 24.76]